MKKLLLLSFFYLLFFSCSKDNCDQERESLEKQRENALKNCGSSFTCVREIERQYQERLKNLKCD